MISLALALLAAQIPPSPSGRVLPTGAVEILNPIAPAVARYEACVSAKFHEAHPTGVGDPDGHRSAVNRAIAQCAEVRRAAVAEAERALSQTSDYRDPVRRDIAIRHAFEGTEHVRRELVAMMRAGQLGGLDPPRATAPAIRVPQRVMPAAMDYMRCMVAGTNASSRLRERAARQARAAALDTECRARGVDALPKVTIGTSSRVLPAEAAALDKAMNDMGASIIASFVGPPELPDENGSADD